MSDSDKINLIVNKYNEYKSTIEKNPYLNIKYVIPMLDSCIVELKMSNYNLVKSLGLFKEDDYDSQISAQMIEVRKKVSCNEVYNKNITGNGIGVAILDTGIVRHQDFGRRIVAFKDFISNKEEPYDNNGHGSHVAGIIGGDGNCSSGVYRGIAPRCNLIIMKVLDHVGNGKVSDVLAGLQWIVDNKERYNIRVVNISVGAMPKNDHVEDSTLVKGVNVVWDKGIVVVVAAGNNGPTPGSVTIPGVSRKVITVGASDDDKLIEAWGNRLIDYSGRGPTNACVLKPEIVAPGSNIISCLNAKNGYIAKSGTSMSTPIVSGAIALLLEKYPDMTPKDVKMKLRDTVVDLGLARNQQGWGQIDISRLLE